MNASTRKIRRTVTILVLAFLAACGQGPEAPPDADGERVYRHALDGAAATLDPAHASTVYSNFLVVNLYDTLYRYRYLQRPYALAPNLAADMPEVSDDGLEVTIRLKRGVRFIDDAAFPDGRGREVTAADFVYSLKRQFDPAVRARGAWLWAGRIVGLNAWGEAGADYDRPVEGLEAVDRHTVRIRLTRPYPQLAHTLAQGYSAVVPREAVETHGAEFARHPVGSGPFRLVSLDSARAELERFTGFREEPLELAAEGYDPASQGGLGLEALEGTAPPFMDRIVVEFVAEDAARWNTYRAGDLDFVQAPTSQFANLLAERDPPRLKPEWAEGHHMRAALETGFVHTDFNMADPRIGAHPDPAQDARNRALRCAIARAFDWDARNAVIYDGMGVVFPGVLPPVVPEYDPDANRDYVQRDVAKARALLAEAGWNADNLPELEYGFSASVDDRQMFEQFRAFLGDIGYPAERIRPVAFASYGDFARAFSEGRLMLITLSWIMDYPDADNTIQLFYGPNAAPGANVANYRNAAYDALYREASVLPPSPERTRLYREMNRVVLEDCATISGIARTRVLLWPKRFAMLPDQSFVGGFFLRFVAPAGSAAPDGP